MSCSDRFLEGISLIISNHVRMTSWNAKKKKKTFVINMSSALHEVPTVRPVLSCRGEHFRGRLTDGRAYIILRVYCSGTSKNPEEPDGSVSETPAPFPPFRLQPILTVNQPFAQLTRATRQSDDDPNVCAYDRNRFRNFFFTRSHSGSPTQTVPACT